MKLSNILPLLSLLFFSLFSISIASTTESPTLVLHSCSLPPLSVSLSLLFVPIKKWTNIPVDSDGFFLPVCAKVYISLFSIVGQVNLNLFWLLFLFFLWTVQFFFFHRTKFKGQNYACNVFHPSFFC